MYLEDTAIGTTSQALAQLDDWHVTKKGEVRRSDWRGLHLGSVRMSDILRELSDPAHPCASFAKVPPETMANKARRMFFCGDALEFKMRPDGGFRLVSAEFCRDRLCPMCNARRSVKQTYRATEAMRLAMERNPGYVPVLITLTLRSWEVG